MYKQIVIDIETIPTQRQDVKDYIAKSVTPPGNISKAETIAKWNEESRPAAVQEAIEKTSFDGAFGQVVCVGIAVGDEKPVAIYSLDERELLVNVNEALYNLPPNELLCTSLVGHNVSAFDLRFLVQRFIVNGIQPHPVITRAAQAKPWDSEKVYDTMTQFAGVGNRISLDKLCLALGLPGKGDITGADVWPMVQAGKLKEVADYCKDDVTKTHAVFKRMTFTTPVTVDTITHEDTVSVTPSPVRQAIAPKPEAKPTLRIGEIANRMGFGITAAFLHSLGFDPSGKEGASVLFYEQDFPAICQALIAHVTEVLEHFEPVTV